MISDKSEIIKKMTEDVGKKYSIFVKGRPPVKGNSTETNKIRKKVLKEEASKQLDYSKPNGQT